MLLIEDDLYAYWIAVAGQWDTLDCHVTVSDNTFLKGFIIFTIVLFTVDSGRRDSTLIEGVQTLFSPTLLHDVKSCVRKQVKSKVYLITH